jgi:CheY-like chemotaxis protein
MSMISTQHMLKELTTTYGYSTSRIAEQAGVSTHTILNLLNGVTKPSVKTETGLIRLYWFCVYQGKDQIAAVTIPAQKPVRNLYIRPPKILLIEGESIMQKMHVQFLKSLSCEVTALTSAQEISTKCTNDFDLIFVDTLLPDINGLMVCAAMRAKYHTYIPIIVLTKQKNLSQQNCDWLTIDKVLTKPASIFDFEEVLKQFLSSLYKQNSLNEGTVTC